KVVKSIQPNARLLALVLAGVTRFDFLGSFFDRLKEKNALDLVDVLTYHGYDPNPDTSYPKIEDMRKFVCKYYHNIAFMQVENGSPSTPRNVTIVALRQLDWTER